MGRPFSATQTARLGVDFRPADRKLTAADLVDEYATPSDLAAYTPATTFDALSAQVAAMYPLVATAVQPAGLATILSAYAQLSALGTAAYAPATDFATAAQGALADTALQPSDPPLSANTVVFSGTLNGGGTTVTLVFDENGRLTSASAV